MDLVTMFFAASALSLAVLCFLALKERRSSFYRGMMVACFVMLMPTSYFMIHYLMGRPKQIEMSDLFLTNRYTIQCVHVIENVGVFFLANKIDAPDTAILRYVSLPYSKELTDQIGSAMRINHGHVDGLELSFADEDADENSGPFDFITGKKPKIKLPKPVTGNEEKPASNSNVIEIDRSHD